MMKPAIYSIKTPSLKLEFCPEKGGCITRFNALAHDEEIPLFRPYDPELAADPLNFSSFPLTPFSNRIGFGKLSFSGKDYRVGPPFGGEPHPNHGSGWQSSWDISSLDENCAVLSLHIGASDESPYSYEAEQEFRLNGNTLSVTMTVKNTGKEPLPFGTGHHPYFIRTPKTVLKANLPQVWMSKDMVPTDLVDVPENWSFKEGRTFDHSKLEAKHGGDGTAYIDHCFSGWDQVATITWPEYQNASLRMTADPIFKHFIIFVPSSGDFFCAEPVTNATDGFNLMAKGRSDTGSIVLNPQETLRGTMSFEFLGTSSV